MSVHQMFLKAALAGQVARAAAKPSRRMRPGLEDQGNQQADIAEFEAIERKKEGFNEGPTDEHQDADKQTGKDNTLRNNDDQDHVAELQVAAEAILARITTAKRHKAALEELAEQLEATIPEGGVSEQTAELVQTALGASEIPEVGEVVAVESFAGDRATATANLATTFRARANAMGRVIDNFQKVVLG